MDFDMQSRPLQIDPVHTRAIMKEVAERLRLMLEQQPEPGSSLQKLISRLPELDDDDSPPIAPK